MYQAQLGEPCVRLADARRPTRVRPSRQRRAGAAGGRLRCTAEASSSSPLRVVITGATKGLGLELARQFVAGAQHLFRSQRTVPCSSLFLAQQTVTRS